MTGLLARIDTGDRAFSERIGVWRAPRWFRAWMICASRLGDGWLWLALALVFLARAEYRVLAAATVASLTGSLSMIVLKRRFRRCRPRPQSTNEFFQLVRADLSSFDSFSFPSGHTVNAFAIGTVLSTTHTSLLPVMTFIACSVGASRVFLRLHFVTDVLVGATLGATIGVVACALAS